MDVKNKLDVIDINSGLGGRVASFLKSGFNVLASVVNGNDSRNTCDLQKNNVPYIISDFSLESIGIGRTISKMYVSG